MRISERQRYAITQSRVEDAKSNNAKMLEMMSTQKRINALSDDPVGAGQAVKYKSSIAGAKQYLRNIDFAKGYIERTESALSGIHEVLIRAKELAVGMANSTYGAESRTATARELKEIMDSVVSMGNSTYGGRYVFGGFRTQTPPLSRDGAFMGDDGAIFLQIGEGTFRRVNLSARELFEATPQDRDGGHFNMIDCLDVLYTGLNTNDVAMIRVAMDELDWQLEKSSSYQATLGSVFNALEETRKRVDLGEELTTAGLSRIEDSDMYEAASDFKKTEAILQSTLLASNKLLQPSLLNFLQ